MQLDDIFNSSETLRASLTFPSRTSSFLEVVSFKGKETTTSPYVIEIVAYCSSDVDAYDLIYLGACFSMDYLGEKKTRHGVITDVTRESRSRYGSLFCFKLEPRAALLSRNHQYRVFENKTAPQIITEVLTANRHIMSPNGYELSLTNKASHSDSGLYEPLSYCVQYGESDWAFITRLMSQWGLGFYFEQDEDASLERLMIMDAFLHTSLPYPRLERALPYEEDSSGMHRHGMISHYQVKVGIVSQSTHLRHYQESSPKLPFDSQTNRYNALANHRTQESDNPRTFPELKSYAYASFYRDLTQKTLDYLTATTQASQTSNHIQVLADTNHVGVGASMVIPVDGVDENQVSSRFWLLTELTFEGSIKSTSLPEEVNIDTEQDYHSHLVSIPLSNTAYRLPILPTPYAESCSAIVLGDTKGEVKSDNENRIQVQFGWSDLNDEGKQSPSAYLRVSQTSASDGFGAQFIPRVGDEVSVDFLDNSPNHPIISGRLYNPKHPYPKSASEYHNGFVTQTPDRQGSNTLWLNDNDNAEQIEFATTGNKVEQIEKAHNVGVDIQQANVVEKRQEITVTQSQSVNVKLAQASTVEGIKLTEVSRDIKVSTSYTEKSSHQVSITESDDSLYLNTIGEIALDANQGITLLVNGSHVTLTAAALAGFPDVNLSPAVIASIPSVSPVGLAAIEGVEQVEQVDTASIFIPSFSDTGGGFFVDAPATASTGNASPMANNASIANASKTTDDNANLPRLLFESKKRPGLTQEGKPAPDYVYGQSTRDDIITMNPAFSDLYQDLAYIRRYGITSFKNQYKQHYGTLYEGSNNKEISAEQGLAEAKAYLFDVWRNWGEWTSSNELEEEAMKMISQVESGQGGVYQSETLTKAVEQHQSTQHLLNQVNELLKFMSKKYKGVQSDIPKSEFEAEAQKGARSLDSLNYNNISDYFEGLTFLIHGIWAFELSLESYQHAGNQYDANIKITIYDHFGLDPTDVTTSGSGFIKYGSIKGFQAWFILQHDQDYGLPPLLTKAEFITQLKGVY